MKTLFICCKELAKNHYGEVFDEILLVDKNISSENIQQFLPRIQDAIRLTHSQISNDDTDKSVLISLDAPVPFFWICDQLKVTMLENEKIVINISTIYQNKDRRDI